MNRKCNLEDITFLIPVRIDSIERLENILTNVNSLLRVSHTNITVLEADNYNNRILERLLPSEVKYIFRRNDDPIFHRTKYINEMAKISTSKIICIWDSDVIVDVIQLEQAKDAIIENNYDVSFPYDGKFYEVTNIIRDIYIESLDFSILSSNISKFTLLYNGIQNGGGILISTASFNATGCEDESFYGWGPEDWNRIEKWNILGLKIFRSPGPLFHLSHPRNINSKYNSKIQQRRLNQLLYDTRDSSVNDILNRINNPDYNNDTYQL